MQTSIIQHGDCFEFIKSINDDSVNLVLTSPPYAMQRAKTYGGIPEEEYSKWIAGWMALLLPKLRFDASVLIIIRSHIRNGSLSDYVLKSRLAIRGIGYNECEELIWLKPDAPPLGSYLRPRRTFEQILWFSKNNKPYINLRALGKPTDRIGFVGSNRFNGAVVAKGQNSCLSAGVARIPDVFTAPVAGNARGLMHPAMFPQALADQLILTFSKENDLVLDPFAGSGTTLLSALALGRQAIGFEIDKNYAEMAQSRLEALITL